MACNASLFRSALVAILVHAVGGNEFRDGLGAAVSPPRSQAFEPTQGRRLASSRAAADNRFEAVAEVDTGPDPFFADLEVIVPQQDDHDDELPRASQKTRAFSVEVFEVQSRGLGRKWREARTGWTYKVRRWSRFRISCTLNKCFNGESCCCCFCAPLNAGISSFCAVMRLRLTLGESLSSPCLLCAARNKLSAPGSSKARPCRSYEKL